MASTKAKVVAVLLLAMTGALAAPVYEIAPGSTITLTQEPCASKAVLSVTPPEVHTHLRRAAILLSGRPVDACYMVVDDTVFGMDESLTMFVGPRSLFRENMI